MLPDQDRGDEQAHDHREGGRHKFTEPGIDRGVEPREEDARDGGQYPDGLDRPPVGSHVGLPPKRNAASKRAPRSDGL